MGARCSGVRSTLPSNVVGFSDGMTPEGRDNLLAALIKKTCAQRGSPSTRELVQKEPKMPDELGWCRGIRCLAALLLACSEDCGAGG